MNLLVELGVDNSILGRELEAFFKQDSDLEGSLLRETVTGLAMNGGKRLRPALTVTGALFGTEFENNKDRIYRAAAIIEAVHLSSLVHDDVIDRAKTRRGKPSLNMSLGSRRAVFAGSYIFLRAVELLAEYTDEKYHLMLNDGLTAMCSGEIRQLLGKTRPDFSLKGYLQKTENKTAGLFSACLSIGAALAKAPDDTVKMLGKAGTEMGIAFQIVDDILDFTQEGHVLGKPAGNDLISGNITLPVIFAIDDIIKEIPDFGVNMSKDNAEKAIRIIKSGDSISRCYELCDSYLKKARRRVNASGVSGEAADKLTLIMKYIADRKH